MDVLPDVPTVRDVGNSIARDHPCGMPPRRAVDGAATWFVIDHICRHRVEPARKNRRDGHGPRSSARSGRQMCDCGAESAVTGWAQAERRHLEARDRRVQHLQNTAAIL